MKSLHTVNLESCKFLNTQLSFDHEYHLWSTISPWLGTYWKPNKDPTESVEVQYFSWFEVLSRLLIAAAKTDAQTNAQNCLLSIRTSRKVSGGKCAILDLSEMSKASCETQAISYRHTAPFSINRKLFLLFKRLKVNADSLLEDSDLTVQILRKQFANLFPVSDFRNLCIFHYLGTSIEVLQQNTPMNTEQMLVKCLMHICDTQILHS